MFTSIGFKPVPEPNIKATALDYREDGLILAGDDGYIHRLWVGYDRGPAGRAMFTKESYVSKTLKGLEVDGQNYYGFYQEGDHSKIIQW